MNYDVFDIETDGLSPTKIHCLSATAGKGIRSTTSYATIRKFATSGNILVGHNIARYDIPAIEKIVGVDLSKVVFIDTLFLSWYLEPERLSHSLESYGEEMGMPKVQIDDWENLSTEDYIRRCTRDVEINKRLFDRQLAHLKKIYGDDAGVQKLITYLMFKAKCAVMQEKQRWKLDIDRCVKGRDELLAEQQRKFQELTEAMPQVPIIKKKVRPKKPFKQDGTHSSIGREWFSLLQEKGLPENYADVVEVITGYEAGNPSSPSQIKEWLFSLGWKPDEFKYIRDETEKSGVRKIPQVNKQTPGEVGVTESVKALYDKEPRLELLDGLSVVTHRLSILNGFLDSVSDDGWIMAEIQGLTNTLRFKHKTVVNLPGVHRAYGELIRGCLIAPEGYELCGSDQSSLEDRVKQHYMMPYDPEFVKEMMTPGFDPHTNLAVFTKAITLEEENIFKAEVKEHPAYAKVKKLRRPYKNTNYACQYGAGAPKIALTAGIPLHEAKMLHEAYWRRNWSVKRVAEDCVVKTVHGQMWLYNPISRLYYSLRHNKDRFSTLCQGSGVYCFDKWVEYVAESGDWPIGQFHDEGIWCILLGRREEFSHILKDAVRKTNKDLKMNRELDIDIKFGNTYAEIH